MAPDFKAAALAAARAADGKKGQDPALLHLGPEHPIADYVLIVTALSKPHLETLEEAVEEALRPARLRPLHRAGSKSERWRVLDFGGLVAHLMTAEARAFYALDKLYDEAPRVRLPHQAARGKSKKESGEAVLHDRA